MRGSASTSSSTPTCGPRRSWYNSVMPRVLLLIAALAIAGAPNLAQTRKTPARRAPVPSTALTKAEPDIACPAPLGTGVRTKLSFCEVLAGRDPAGGLLIRIPAHKGPASLSFDLHNLHLYSEELVKARRAYARYTATIGVL